jgi:hypothetical protein
LNKFHSIILKDFFFAIIIMINPFHMIFSENAKQLDEFLHVNDSLNSNLKNITKDEDVINNGEAIFRRFFSNCAYQNSALGSYGYEGENYSSNLTTNINSKMLPTWGTPNFNKLIPEQEYEKNMIKTPCELESERYYAQFINNIGNSKKLEGNFNFYKNRK